MKKIWSKHKLLIITASCFVLLVATVYFLTAPFVNKIKEKSDKIQEKIIDNQITGERTASIPKMEELDNGYESEKKYFDVILDPEREIDFIKELESLADETGNKIALKVNETNDPNDGKTKKTAGNKKNEKTIKEDLSYDNYIVIQIDLYGDYQEMMNFIRKLENFKYFCNIISIECKKETEISESRVLPSDSKNIFSKPSFYPVSGKTQVESVEKNEKDTLHSIINVVVYIKK